MLDNELNNYPVHRLVDWNNVNTSEDNISLWRKTKKSSSQGIQWLIMKWQDRKQGKTAKGKGYAERTLDEPRRSTDTRQTIRTSSYSSRASFHSTRSQVEADAIQMTRVPAIIPVAEHDLDNVSSAASPRPVAAFSYQGGGVAGEPQHSDPGTSNTKPETTHPPLRSYGSLIDPTKQATERARFKKDCWKNVQVGDFVRIYNEDQIPADVLILSTSDPDGACYVETKNLDGETNLKVRQALHSGRKVKHARDCEKTAFVIESEPPHANLYQYSGIVRWNQQNTSKTESPGKELAEPISINNLLLRGCSLRNTEWVLAVVIFTGRETKIMLNAGITPSKSSRISRELNWNVIYNFGILLCMCVISGIVQGVTWSQGNNSLDYFEFGSIGGRPSLDGFITFWTAVILFQNLVPISLWISIEIIKTAQAFFIYSDASMYYDKLDYPCTP